MWVQLTIIATALGNAKGTEQFVKPLSKYINCWLVLTLSIAAVQVTGQEPLNGNTKRRSENGLRSPK